MLVVTRKNEEPLILGHDLEVTVLEIRGNRLKLGIRAPVDVPIYRKELEARIILPTPDTGCARTVAAPPDVFAADLMSARLKQPITQKTA